MAQLREAIEQEITDAERRLAHWKDQERTRGDLADHIRPILAAYENQLTALYSARDALND